MFTLALMMSLDSDAGTGHPDREGGRDGGSFIADPVDCPANQCEALAEEQRNGDLETEELDVLCGRKTSGASSADGLAQQQSLPPSAASVGGLKERLRVLL